MADEYGPNNVYANLPPIDDRGENQIAKFMRWNPDPIGTSQARLAQVHPDMQAIVAKARADNPNLNFIVGSGLRSADDQANAYKWGWSTVKPNPNNPDVNQRGIGADLWPLDKNGRPTFDQGAMTQVGQAMKTAAQELGMPITWGGDWNTFKDRTHFQLNNPSPGYTPGEPLPSGPAPNVSASTAPKPLPGQGAAGPGAWQGGGTTASNVTPPAARGTTINTTGPQPSAPSLSPTDRDYVIRTVAAEADHPGGDAAVASVIRNRLQDGQWGGTAKSVVQYPGQFSAWNKVTGYAGGAGANALVNISSDSPTYKRIGGIVDDVFSGATPDPTKGALNFYAPGGMKGGQAPGWWSQVNNPIRIGAQWYGTAPGENQRVTGAPLAAPPVAAATPAPTPLGQGGIGSDAAASARAAPATPAVASAAPATPAPFNWATQMQPAAKGQAPTLADNLNKMLGKGQGQGQGQQGADQIKAPAMPPMMPAHIPNPMAEQALYGTTINSMGSAMPNSNPLAGGNPMAASSGGVLSPGLPGYQPIGAQLSGISPYAMMQFGPGALGMESGGIGMNQQNPYALLGAGGISG